MSDSHPQHHEKGGRRRVRRKRTLKRLLGPAIAVLFVLLALATWWFVLQDRGDGQSLQAPAPASAPADRAGLVRLPADDAPHHNTTEWWYYNGHLRSDTGQRYAYHVAVFLRRELSDHTIFHVSLVDLQTGRHYTGQARTAGVPSTVRQDGFDFVYPGWRVAGSGPKHALDIKTKDFHLVLDLSDAEPPTLHQARGSGGPGLLDFGTAGKSYYYSRMRMPSRGSLTLGGTATPVSGDSWFDHQWGDFESTALKWNWFAIQLDDGGDIMLFEVFDERGALVTQAGTISREGRMTMLGSGDYSLRPITHWTSPDSKVTYPVDWAISIPVQNLALTAKALVKGSEFNGLETILKIYWEGPVGISGSSTGVGYLELSGYGKAGGK
jgi:predicted secreted hydrolase